MLQDWIRGFCLKVSITDDVARWRSNVNTRVAEACLDLSECPCPPECHLVTRELLEARAFMRAVLATHSPAISITRLCRRGLRQCMARVYCQRYTAGGSSVVVLHTFYDLTFPWISALHQVPSCRRWPVYSLYSSDLRKTNLLNLCRTGLRWNLNYTLY